MYMYSIYCIYCMYSIYCTYIYVQYIILTKCLQIIHVVIFYQSCSFVKPAFPYIFFMRFLVYNSLIPHFPKSLRTSSLVEIINKILNIFFVYSLKQFTGFAYTYTHISKQKKYRNSNCKKMFLYYTFNCRNLSENQISG